MKKIEHKYANIYFICTMNPPSLTGGSKSLKLWVEKITSRVIIKLRPANLTIKNKGGIVMKRDNTSSLAYSK